MRDRLLPPANAIIGGLMILTGLIARFDEAYLAYRRQVPFIIPRLRRRG